MKTKKVVVSTLNAVKFSTLGFYLYYETTYKLTKRYQPQWSDKVLSIQNSKSVGEIKYYYNKSIIYPNQSRKLSVKLNPQKIIICTNKC